MQPVKKAVRSSVVARKYYKHLTKTEVEIKQAHIKKKTNRSITAEKGQITVHYLAKDKVIRNDPKK